MGYHYVIKLDGTVEGGRPEYWTGAHAKGHNLGSIGVCLIGRDDFTREQNQSLVNLLIDLLHRHKGAKVIGHNEVSDKTCPNFDVQVWLSHWGFK